MSCMGFPQLQEGVQFFNQNVFRNSADALVHQLTIFQEDDGGDVANAVFHANLAVVVHIDLSDDGFAVILFRQFFDNGTDHAAGTAPFGPEINDHRLIAVQGQLFKVLAGEFYSHDKILKTFE